MRTTIVRNVRRMFEKHFLVHSPKNSSYIQKDLGLNVWELNEMYLYVEQLFKIQLEDHETNNIKTVKDLVYCVERKQENKFAA
jgi:acyl carrier protein